MDQNRRFLTYSKSILRTSAVNPSNFQTPSIELLKSSWLTFLVLGSTSEVGLRGLRSPVLNLENGKVEIGKKLYSSL